ncbi:uncharacterized protein LOC134533352 [Bacillus rossius redtenbacheri]|uniref:uncharacterized protein LOC134533352 n=1 Tax=Bacillus rossius redtenbacheri TaxID=93214 RepID=UPI002FDDEDCB
MTASVDQRPALSADTPGARYLVAAPARTGSRLPVARHSVGPRGAKIPSEMQHILLVLLAATPLALCRPQFFQPLLFHAAPPKPAVMPHRAVVLNAEAESRLPAHMQNHFYKDPRISAALAKESWFTADEQQVIDREADKIPRSKIFSIIRNAGLDKL